MYLYKLNKKTNKYSALPTLSFVNSTGLGESVAFDKSGKTLAVGAISYRVGTQSVGALYVYEGKVGC